MNIAEGGSAGREARGGDQIIPVDTAIHTQTHWESVEPVVEIDGNRWLIVQMKMERDIYDQADWVEAIVVPDGHRQVPDYGDTVIVSCEMRSDQTARGNIMGIPHTMFYGKIANYRNKGDKSFKIQMNNFTADLLYQDVTIQQGHTPELISNMVEMVVEQAGEVSGGPRQSDITIEGLTPGERQLARRSADVVMDPGTRSGTSIDQWSGNGPIYGDNGVIVGEGVDYETTFTGINVTAAEVLDKFARWTESQWWVDRAGVFKFGELETQIRPLTYILDSSAGMLTPPYQSVRVIGEDVSGRDGAWDAKGQVEKNPNVVTAAITDMTTGDDNSPVIDVGSVREPVFEYKSQDIKTQEQATKTAQDLATELATQLQGGKVHVVGRPDIDLYDQIVMPDYLGGYEYVVGGLEHRFNPQDGFITIIETIYAVGLDANKITIDEESYQPGSSGDTGSQTVDEAMR